ncbi:MAG: PKD domain-containing protein [Bacteroidetes bacterium]|nr:MAG: PKD domain-containing protein [Bacteroidota bacterium]
MKNLILSCLTVLLTALQLIADPVTVSGFVHYEDGTPAIDWPVFVGEPDPAGNGDIAFTDATGFYSIVVDVPAGTPVIEVQTFDNCGPQMIPAEIIDDAATAEFILCSDIGGPDCWVDVQAALQPGLSVAFSAEPYSLDSLATYTYLWDFGDGNTSTEQNPAHTYDDPGEYLVTLSVNSDACDLTITMVVEVFEAQLVTVFGQVTDQSGAGVPGWFVLVDNGNPDFPGFATTNQLGEYSLEVSLPVNATEATASTFDFCTPMGLISETAPIVNAEAEINFSICFDSFPPPPDCGAYISYTHLTGLTYEFMAHTYAPDSLITFTYEWDFGDGATSTEQNPTHTYAEDGVYTVLLTVTSSDGCIVHACEVICTHGGFIDTFYYDCQAMFATGWGGLDPAGGFDPLTLDFIDLSFGIVSEWSWDFGDGSTSSEQNPVHTYAEPGLYMVTLSIVTVDGCESSITMEVYAGDDFPWTEFDCQAMFLPIPDSTGGGFFFLDLSVSNTPITSWEWDFGDGMTSNEQNPYHEYTTPGLYTVSLVIEADSCNSVISFDLDTTDPFHGFDPDGAVLGQAAGVTTSVEPTITLEGLRVYPNPASEMLNLVFSSQEAQNAQLSVLNTSGQVVRAQQVTVVSGTNAVQVPVASLTPGFYLAQFRTAAGIQTVKFVRE